MTKKEAINQATREALPINHKDWLHLAVDNGTSGKKERSKWLIRRSLELLGVDEEAIWGSLANFMTQKCTWCSCVYSVKRKYAKRTNRKQRENQLKILRTQQLLNEMSKAL